MIVVDDDEDDIFILEGTLRDAGYSDIISFIANSGKDLLEHLENHHGNGVPDVILLDIAMPVMDGMEALEKIRHNPKFQNIPVLMVTGSNEYAQMILRKHPDLKYDGVLLKPITVESLTNALRLHR
jgi:CheY-like chemotaxis protein